MHNLSLESPVGSDRSQTRNLDGAVWTIDIHVVLWVIQNILESRYQVGTSSAYLSFSCYANGALEVDVLVAL